MLSVVPFDGSLTGGQREIAVRAKMPQNASIARSVRVINLYYPILIPHGKYQVSVIRRIYECIGMCQVRCTVGSVREWNVVERRPSPNRPPLRIPIDQQIAFDGADVGERLAVTDNQDQMSIGEFQEVMIHAYERWKGQPCRCKPLLDIGQRNLGYDVASQVNLLDCIRLRVEN